MNEEEFLNNVKKVKSPRSHKIKNSYGVYDYYKYYRKHKPKESKYVLSESQYFAIIRKVNEYLMDSLIEGNDITLPYRLGRIELRKRDTYVKFDGKKIRTNRAIDWDKTLKLWYEDSESYKNKTLIRTEDKSIFRVYYNRVVADYTNKSFFTIDFNRDFKRRLKTFIKDGKIDAFII